MGFVISCNKRIPSFDREVNNSDRRCLMEEDGAIELSYLLCRKNHGDGCHSQVEFVSVEFDVIIEKVRPRGRQATDYLANYGTE